MMLIFWQALKELHLSGGNGGATTDGGGLTVPKFPAGVQGKAGRGFETTSLKKQKSCVLSTHFEND